MHRNCLAEKKIAKELLKLWKRLLSVVQKKEKKEKNNALQ